MLKILFVLAMSVQLNIFQSDSIIPPPDPYIISFGQLYDMCAREPADVICSGNTTNKKLTFAQVKAIDLVQRLQFVYEDDIVQYNQGDYYSAHNPGDCEDYVFVVSNALAQHGQDGRFMRLVMMKMANGAHAALQVDTADKGTVEFGVIPDEWPGPIIEHYALREAYVTMNGQQKVVPNPGYIIKAQYFVTAAPY